MTHAANADNRNHNNNIPSCAKHVSILQLMLKEPCLWRVAYPEHPNNIVDMLDKRAALHD